MSLIITARLITRGCRSQALSFNFNSINQKIFNGKNNFKMAASLTQKRGLCDKKEVKVKADDDLEQIYYAPYSTKIKIVKIFSITTSICSIMVQPYLLPNLLESGSVAAPVALCTFTCFFTFVTPALLHMVTSKYVNSIYYNKETKSYIATTYSIFAREKKLEFTPADVEQPGMGQMLTNCHIKGRPLLINFDNFTNVDHYALIMGYDKQINYTFQADIDSKKVSRTRHANQRQAEDDEINEKKSMKN